MATPSSSGTSPSPGLSFTLPASASENSTDGHNDTEQAEREERRKKLLARTEFAKITRALRSTLALASYKTRHNVANVPLQNLEALVAQRPHSASNQSSGQASLSLFPATFGNEKKRKAGSSTNNAVFYNSPLSQGNTSYGVNGIGLGVNASSSSMSMGMPSQHPSYTFPPPNPSIASTPTNPSKSLFASILSLPPAKRARTIHNPEAPPVPPPPPPPQTHAKRTPKKSTKKGKDASGTSKGKAADKKGKGKEKEKKSTVGRARANSIDSVRSSFSGETDNVNDTDMKAAETLTDLLFSRSGATGSPHSSFSAATSASRMVPAGPTVSALPLSQASSGSSVAPSAAQQHKAHVRTASNATTASVSTSILERDHPAPHMDKKSDGRRSATPTMNTRSGTRPAGAPAGQSLSAQASHVFGAPAPPKQQAVDSEAADLMLLLANSPSPARPTVPRDQDITRNAYAAGRVLFPSGPSGSQSSDGGGGVGGGLKRGASFSGIDGGEVVNKNAIRAGSESEAATSPPLSQAELSPALEPQGSPSAGTILRPVPTLNIGQLLPSPPSLAQAGPLTPSGFHLTDYINVTPSPAAPSAPGPRASQSSSASHPAQQSTSSHSSQQLSSAVGSNSTGRFNSAVSVSSPLRKSFDRDGVGLGVNARKLFETEPSTGGGAGSGGGTGRKMRFGEGVEGAGSLGSGIDLVQT